MISQRNVNVRGNDLHINFEQAQMILTENSVILHDNLLFS